jgi:hypothetical protein
VIRGFRNPLLLLLLLGLTVALRWPAFDPQYYATDESFHLAAAQRMVQGHPMYLEVWDNRPPLLPWVYAAVVALFGSHALWAIRILAILLAFWAAVLMGSLYNRYRFSARETALPAFLFACWLNGPWYTLELNAELPMLILCLLMARFLADYFIEEQRSWGRLFAIGAMAASLVLLKYQGILLALAFVVSYFSIAASRFRELLVLLAGALWILLAAVFILYFQGSLVAFFQQGLLYNLDYLLAAQNPDSQVNGWGFVEYLKVWGVPLLVALLGFLYLRGHYFSLAIRQRRMETIMAWWLIASLLSIPLGGWRMYLHYFLLVLPPLTFYFVYFLQNLVPRWLRPAVLLLALAATTVLYASYPLARTERLFRLAEPKLTPAGWMHGLRTRLQPDPNIQALDSALRSRGISGIWVVDFRPELYTALKQRGETKYMNFYMARARMTWLTENLKRPEPISRPESLADFYAELLRARPQAILDPVGHMPELQQRLLWLQQHYEPDTIGHMPVYFLRASSE